METGKTALPIVKVRAYCEVLKIPIYLMVDAIMLDKRAEVFREVLKGEDKNG